MFFFFNDTATTEIYTLSLHDALPIWGRWIAYAVLVTLTGLAHMLALLVLAGHAFVVLSRWWLGRDRRLLRWIVVTAVALDRKSTRLNSSHANISYAVFCLEKKTR